jgi:hypothetical protein
MKREQLKRLLGKRGVSGVRLREATEPDMLTVRDLLQGKIREVLKLSGDDDPWPYVVALYADNVVVEIDGKLMSYGYTISGQDVALGNPVEVTREFRPPHPLRLRRPSSKRSTAARAPISSASFARA